MQERRDESYEEADADEYGDADVDGRVLQHVRDETHGVNGAEPGDRREEKEDESRYHFAVERKEEDGTAEDRVREVAHKKCAADNAQGTFRHGKAQAEADHEHAQERIYHGRRADGRYEPVRQGYVEQGEEQQDDVTVKAYAAEDDAGHFFCVHAGSAADSGGYGVVAAHGHDGVADIAEADEDEDGRGKEALDEGHGEHADIITGDVDHDEAAAVPVSAACEPAETQTEKIEQESEQEQREDMRIRKHAVEIPDDGAGQGEVEDNYGKRADGLLSDYSKPLGKVSNQDEDQKRKHFEKHVHAELCAPVARGASRVE